MQDSCPKDCRDWYKSIRTSLRASTGGRPFTESRATDPGPRTFLTLALALQVCRAVDAIDTMKGRLTEFVLDGWGPGEDLQAALHDLGEADAMIRGVYFRLTASGGVPGGSVPAKTH